MSIYARLWSLKFPEFGDGHSRCNWIRVTAQGVPPHIGSPTPGLGYEDGDPYSSFLPPAIVTNEDGESEFMRAVVFVAENAAKGTSRSGQEYVNPLCMLSGKVAALLKVKLLHREHLYWSDLDVDLELESLKHPEKYPFTCRPTA